VAPAAPAPALAKGRPKEPPPVVGFPAPSPLVVPVVNTDDLDEPSWISTDDLVDADELLPSLPPTPPSPATRPGGDAADGEEFIIELD
jgi:hypothetical protein